jgi:hypothetical protein
MKIARVIGMAALAGSLHAGHRMRIDNNPSVAPDVTVYVDNVLNLQTKALASRMFAAVGVRVVWRLGEPQPNAAGGLVVGVRFAESPSLNYRGVVLARAYPFGGSVRSITVFRNRVLVMAEASRIEQFKLMAHVLVHEIGHVLERNDHHSDTGVMKAQWTPADYEAMAWKPLPFEEEDIAWIHRTLEELPRQRPSGGRE